MAPAASVRVGEMSIKSILQKSKDKRGIATDSNHILNSNRFSDMRRERE